jgi:hypothetical protein
MPSFIIATRLHDEQIINQALTDNQRPTGMEFVYEVYGQYHLEGIYDLLQFQRAIDASHEVILQGKYCSTSKVFEAFEQDEQARDDLVLLKRQIVIT